jgi:hypothetical protein
MSGQNTPNKTAAEQAVENNVEAAVEGTFPASDPTGNASAQGARAVPPEDMMHASGSKAHDHTASVSARFGSMESAKLAVEALVRDGPVDRRCAQVEPGDDAATVRISVSEGDRKRLGEMLQRQSGRTG